MEKWYFYLILGNLRDKFISINFFKCIQVQFWSWSLAHFLMKLLYFLQFLYLAWNMISSVNASTSIATPSMCPLGMSLFDIEYFWQ